MDIEQLRTYCLSVRGAWESFPFDDSVLVFKIMDKMFAFVGLEVPQDEMTVCLKCDPARSVELRERYEGIGKSHYGGNSLLWNGIRLESDVPDDLIRELVDHSVQEVVRNMPRKKREEYLNS
ncbi:MAG: MmcQ/YjbR family DNA-binding protein [Rikenellaceae bacterium]|nr:MmcQ/YjbR family DNA-binding protein [Rikenellaceae bacterium]